MDPEELTRRVESLPGMEALVRALAGLPPAFLVGGAVRDILRGAPPVDLDVAIEGDASAAARELARRLGGETVTHGRFATASVRAPAATVDVAATRRERYLRPGALPEVEPATLAEDLARRDFSVNAIAVELSGADRGRVHDPCDGIADLERRAIRVLHERSFLDDPTRLLRALRYEARLGGRLEQSTERLARAAIDAGAPATVSGPRIAGELLMLLGEPERERALARMRELGLDRALCPALTVEARTAAAAAEAAADVAADPALAALAALVAGAPAELSAWVDRLQLARVDRDAVTRAATAAPSAAARLAAARAPSEVHDLLDREPPETLALALALGAPRDAVVGWLSGGRATRLEVTGDDLVAAGLPPSPALGRALRETLRRKLDGDVSGRDEELELAVALARAAETEDGDAGG